MADANPIRPRRNSQACATPGWPAPHPGDLPHGSASAADWQSRRIAGFTQALRVSRGAVDFLFTKLAETGIPATLLTAFDDGHSVYSGVVTGFENGEAGLRVDFSQCAQPFCIAAFCTAWLVFRPCVAGGATALTLFDDRQQLLASISGQHSQCIAWGALSQWLALRESRVDNCWAEFPRIQGDTHDGH